MDKKKLDGLSGGIFMIGLGLLFLLPGVGIWPWILVVIGASSLPASLAAKKGWYGWQSFVWMCGLAVLFASGFFWPGILILAGISALLAALTKQSPGSPFDSDRPEPESWDGDLSGEINEDDTPSGAFSFDASPPTRPIDLDELDVTTTQDDVDNGSAHNTTRLEE